MEVVYKRIKNAEWHDDPMVETLAAQAQDPDEYESEFCLLQHVSARCGPQELAGIHLDNGLWTFKCNAASVCNKIARCKCQPLPPLLSVKWEERPTLSIIDQYQALIHDYECVTLQVTSAVAHLKRLGYNWMKADGRHWSDVGCTGCRRYHV